MRAIDAAQLIVNRLSRIGKSTDRNDLTKMLYLLDLTVLKHTGKRLVDEEFSFNDRGPFIEDVYKHFQLWKDDYISGEVQVKHNLSEDFLKMLKEKISAIGKCKSWELDAIIYNQQNNGKTQELTFDGFDPEKVVMPAEFIHDFDSYCEQLKDKIEANNEIEKVKFAEYQAKQKLEALEAKQKEIEKMEAKLQADKAKIDELRKNLSNSGIEL